MRDICHNFLQDFGEPIGGPEQVVEVDESKFFHRKYHRGQYREGHWVLGGVERGSGRCFMVVVEDRREVTLVPLLLQFIHPGSIVITDEWASYRRLYDRHLTVNHRIGFVSPDDPAVHKNTIEGMWALLYKNA